MASSSCSQRGPICFIVSVTLAFMAISTAVNSISKNSEPPIMPISHELSTNASNALQQAGFSITADLLRRSPVFYLPQENSTIFAVKDSAIKNTTLPPWILKDLLLYHTVTSKLSMEDLLKKPSGSCIQTRFRRKNIAITKIDWRERSVEINHVLISRPDLFLGEKIAIHGVLAPFSFLNSRENRLNWDIPQSPICRSDFNSGLNSDTDDLKKKVGWKRIVNLLSSNGYASFSIALHSVVDGILRDSVGFDSVTILAPPHLALIGASSPLLDRAVRLHILPQRLTYRELASMPTRTLLKTLVPDEDLEIEGVLEFMPGMMINGAEVVAPDVFTSDKFVIHGLSRAFSADEFLTS